jgi:hypothetical protein
MSLIPSAPFRSTNALTGDSPAIIANFVCTAYRFNDSLTCACQKFFASAAFDFSSSVAKVTSPGTFT